MKQETQEKGNETTETTETTEATVVSQYEKEKEYWLNKLSGELVKSCFPYDQSKKEKTGGRTKGQPAIQEAEIVLPAGVSERLIKVGTGKDHRIHMVLLAAVTLLMERYTGGLDIILGVPIYKQEKEGKYVNTAVAIRQNLPADGGISFKELLLSTRTTMMEAIENQNYPLDILQYQLDISTDEDETALFDTVVMLENIHDKEYLRDVSRNVLFNFKRNENTVEGNVEYNENKYNKETIQQLIEHFLRLLAGALENIETPVKDLEILTQEDKDHLLATLNDTEREYPKDKTIAQLFREEVQKGPDRVAVLDLWTGDRGSNKQDPHYITYGELDRQVRRVAARLQQSGVKQDTVVAVQVTDPLNLITGILAALTAGGGYMPIDPDYPPERKQLMIRDSHAAALLKTEDQEVIIPEDETTAVLDIAALKHEGDVPGEGELVENTEPESLAYVLYTSGSTGGPKGVMVTNRGVVRLVKNTDYQEFSETTRMLQNGSPVFDALTYELWGAYLNGGQLVLADKEFILDAWKLGDAIKRYRINSMLLTPVFFNQLVQQDEELFQGMEWLLVGGDVLSPSHINRARKSNKGLKIVNAYGPTENTVIATTHLIETDYDVSVPIGKPIHNSTVYILGPHNRLQPPGVVGELHVGGDGVARGYMNNPELTAEKFVASPFAADGKKLYRTGDLARWRPDGNIEFLSRQDFQVKIRGHRIELGEIENRLLKHDEIKDAIVLLTGDKEKPTLCAYYVSDIDLTVPDLKIYMGEGLPNYMVPSYFIQLEKLPCTPTGKIDRKALPDPKTMVTEEKSHQTPTNKIEAQVLKIWADVLELDPETISIDDDFFELGGNSINILKVQAQLREYFECEISMSTMFLYPTIRELAADILKSAPEKNLESVVQLNKCNAEKNIFLFHPMHGMIFQYYDLAKQLEGCYNVYGIQARGLTNMDPLPESFTEMLGQYLEEIKVIQPEGPYIFSGYCVGNISAYEAAREMEKQGQTVDKLILMDIGSFTPAKTNRFKNMRLYVERKLFTYHINHRPSPPEHLDQQANMEQKQCLNRVKANNNMIFFQYVHEGKIDSPILHIRAEENLSAKLFHRLWKKNTRGNVTFDMVTGNHHTMLASPHVEKLAEIIKNNIE
jgi:amino acid adenylation domain-containing protein